MCKMQLELAHHTFIKMWLTWSKFQAKQEDEFMYVCQMFLVNALLFSRKWIFFVSEEFYTSSQTSRLNPEVCEFLRWFEVMESTIRGHPNKMYKKHCNSNVRINYFTNRVINVWNFLPVTVNFSTSHSLKRSRERVHFKQFLFYN